MSRGLDSRRRGRAGLLPLLVVLCSCTSWPELTPEVDQALRDMRPSEVVASEPIPSELMELAQGREPTEPNLVGLLSAGADAFTARLHLIRSARESIDIQTFNWVSDDAGGALVVELFRAARRGVVVRLLVDQMTQAYREELSRFTILHENLQLRFYNPISSSGSLSTLGAVGKATFDFDGLNERMHNKVFVVDDAVAIVGGRNVEEKYFDLDPEFCYLDRDAIVIGPTVHEVAESFDEYWEHPIVVRAEALKGVGLDLLRWREDGRPADPELPVYPRCAWALEAAGAYAAEEVLPHSTLYEVDRLEYLYDPPGKRDSSGSVTNLGDERFLQEAIREADEYVVAQSNYLVLTETSFQGLSRFHREKPEVPFLFVTNSLAATSNLICYGIARKQRFRQLRVGLDIFEMRPVPEDIREFCPRYDSLCVEAAGDEGRLESYGNHFVGTDPPGPQFAIHAKTMVVDGDVVLVGSHNFDPRSSRYNTEAGLLIWDDELGAEAEAEIRTLVGHGNSWVVAQKKHIPVWTPVSGVFARVSRSLPILDLWPYRHHSCYELREGAEEVLPSDPAFHENYRSVGQFPGVDSLWREWQVRFFGGFVGFARPLL